MKIISELTGQEYKTVQECEEAETAYLEEIEAKKVEEAKLKEERKARAAEVRAAYEAIKDAEKVYFELRNKFIEDYGYYHESHTSQVKIPNTGSFLDEVFSMLFR
jgi:viroplasmin and RNaseH domain-containing protein